MAKKKNRNAAAQPVQNNKSLPADKPSSSGPVTAIYRPADLTNDTQDGTDMAMRAEDSWLGLGLNERELDAFKNYSKDHQEVYTVVKSIYGQAARLDIGRKTVWGKHLLGFEVDVQALDDGDIFVRLDVELPPEYPKIGATFHLLELEPDSETLKLEIAGIMNAGAKKWQNDNQMVTEILTEVGEKLNDVHAEQQRRAQGTSLEQERATTESAAQADAISREQNAQRQKEAEARAREADLALQVESHRRRRQLLSSGHSGLDHQKGVEEDYPEDCVVFNRDITVYDPKRDTDLSFRAVRPVEILYERDGKRVTTAVPFRNGQMILFFLVLKEVRLPPGMDSEAQYRSLLNKIENNLLETKSFDHAAIVKIYDFKLEQVFGTGSVPHWEFTILTERANGGPLPALVAMTGGIYGPELRRYARSILDAFEFYDRKGYVHPAIHAHNILFFGEEHRVYCAKLSDGYGTALRGLVDQAHFGKKASELNQGPWAPPELSSDRPIRNNKTCIFELGIVLLQMVLGNDLANEYTSPQDALERGKLDIDFDDLISTMCHVNPKKRPTAFQLQSHHYFQSHMPFLFEALNRAYRMRSQSSSDSKWAEDWEPVGKLGKGGFGTVFKARNRMDGHFYAVKQMKCKTIKDMTEIKGEVRMLASLNHPVIVRYFNAWTEDDQQDSTETDDSTVPTDPRSFALPTDSAAPPSNMFALPSTGHDFLDPSLAQLSDVEEEEEEEDKESSDDGNMFGYQSPPSDSDEDNSQAVESEGEENEEDEEPSDPFELQAVANALDDGPKFFESQSPRQQREITKIPSQPQPFKAAGAEPSMFRRPTQYYNKNSTLYIQMELCETGTLLDLIKNGLPDATREIWRLLRLILDGLDHIHHMKVVHRDLKPMNIFIDAQKMPKIGDFGLASPSQATADGTKVATHIAGPQSKGVGTIFYIAPELEEKKGSGEYSAKADMFALGVILFEMCFPFKTTTERFNWLGSINRDPTKLPARFDSDEYRVQGRIIKSLLNHDPDQRPSARDLLLDPEIPEPLETEKESRYIQRLIHGNNEQLQRVMDTLMSKTADRSQLLAYAHIGTDEFGSSNLHAISWIVQELEEVFRTHGGIESSRETVFPAEGLYPIEQKPVRFIDAAGYAVQLPYDLTVPFARAIAVQKPEFGKFFCFGRVFRQREAGVEPLCIPEVDFDLVSYSARDLSLKDAQVISVLDDCLTKLSSLFARSFSIVISHGDLLDLILSACEVPEGRLEVVKHLLSSLNVGKHTWKQVQSDLQKSAGLAATTVAAIGQFNISSTFEEMRQHVLTSLRKLKKGDSAMKAARPLNRLQEVDDFLGRLRVRTAVLFSPLSCTSEVLYKGSLMFKCVESKLRKIVAVGGRYDALVRSYQTPTHKTFARAAGVRINVMDLARFASIDAQPQSGKSAKSRTAFQASIPARVDVVITSFDEEILHSTCLEILRNVLDAGISSEVSEPFSSMDELDKCYSESTRYWVVIVRPVSGNQRAIKVRSPSREETDIPASELVDHLRTEVGGGTTVTTTEPTLRRTRSSHGASDRENIVILTPQHKSKKVNRAAIVDSARTAAQELAETMRQNFKVLAIDTDDDTLHRIRNTRLSDGESWRSLRHSVALTEREYVQEIQEQLQDWSNRGQEGAFLCNYKTKTCIIYDFGKS